MEIINKDGNGVWKNKKMKAVIPGGVSAPVLPVGICETLKMDYEAISSAGSMLGSGGITVIDEDTCMVRAISNIIKFFHHESCGQCTPCREGMGWLDKIIKRILKGNGKLEDLDLLDEICQNMMGRTICVLADAGAMPVRSF